MTRRGSLPLLVLIVLFLTASRAAGADLGPLARDLAERISALPVATEPIRIDTHETGAVSFSELRAFRQLVVDELRKRRVRLSQEPGVPTISISFADGVRGRLLIAETEVGDRPDAIILPVPAGASVSALARRVTLQKSLIWRQDDPILDFVVLPGKLLVLSSAKISLIENDGAGWKEQYGWDLGAIEHLPRDPRGRLLVVDSQLRAYLPNHDCRAAVEPGSRLECQPNDTGWPVVAADPSDTRIRPAPGKNYFTELKTSNGTLDGLPPFYAAAVLRGQQEAPLWAVSTLADDTRIYDSQRTERGRARGWGSTLASAEVAECGAWLVASVGADAGKQALQAFQWASDHPIAGSDPLELDGVTTALWADEGNRVRLVTRDLKSGKYAAWSVALVCAD